MNPAVVAVIVVLPIERAVAREIRRRTRSSARELGIDVGRGALPRLMDRYRTLAKDLGTDRERDPMHAGTEIQRLVGTIELVPENGILVAEINRAHVAGALLSAVGARQQMVVVARARSDQGAELIHEFERRFANDRMESRRVAKAVGVVMSGIEYVHPGRRRVFQRQPRVMHNAQALVRQWPIPPRRLKSSSFIPVDSK